MFEGKFPLVKFGQFVEVSNASETEISSADEETEDEVITASEHEEEPVSPMEIIAEEHVLVTDEEENDDVYANDDDESDFERGLMDNVVNEYDGEDDMDQGEDITNYDNDDLIFVATPTQPTQEGPSVIRSYHEVGSSLAPRGSSPPIHVHDAASERLARLLVQPYFDSFSRSKGISIREGNVGGADPSVFDLKAEIGVLNQKLIEKDVLIGNLDVQVSELEEENSSKSKQISSLQVNLGALMVGYYDLKNKLIVEFVDEFKTIVEDPNATQTSQSATANTSQYDQLGDTPPAWRVSRRDMARHGTLWRVMARVFSFETRY
uniref:Uncharacterized protein n=1 Tax=Lactuca sativa TaxID=4236 RepID=A0A9R1XKX0_LACSA|nr:hypothetical protein LSAT_V11C300126710 [Lactuca sativa]